MTGQPRTFADAAQDAINRCFDALGQADARYATEVAHIMGAQDRRTHQELGHMDRRVLDPTQRAHARRINDTWIVTAGLGTIIATDRDHAWTTALTHNATHDFDCVPTDRRTA